jgi:ABC-type Fe3+-siderophore transport system permease subunit
VSSTRRLVLVLSVLSGVLVLVAAGALFLGSAQLSPSAVLSAVAGRAAPESVERVVTLSIRLPRIAAALLAGGALAVAGVAFQALTRNPLAEPSVLGISAGAAFGVVIG